MTPYFYAILTIISLLGIIAASEMARHRGLNPRVWFYSAALFGPLVLPLLFFRRRPA